jgi:hypothetical protein
MNPRERLPNWFELLEERERERREAEKRNEAVLLWGRAASFTMDRTPDEGSNVATTRI